MNKKLVIIFVVVTLYLSSCGVLPIGNSSELSGTAWSLDSFNGTALIPESAMTAFFEDGGVRGSASCNHYFGSYSIKGDKIEIEGLGWTEMACMEPEGLMEQEQILMALFSQASTISIRSETLQLMTEKGDLLIFRYLSTED